MSEMDFRNGTVDFDDRKGRERNQGSTFGMDLLLEHDYKEIRHFRQARSSI